MEAEMSYLLEEQGREIATLVKRLANAELLIEKLKEEVGHWEEDFAMFDRAHEKAIGLWRKEHPDAGYTPDMSDLNEWMVRRVEKAEVVKESLTTALGGINEIAEETNNDTHDRPVETLLLIKELGRMSKKLDALKGSLRNIADNAAHWDTGCGPDASAFGWIHDIAESALRTAEDSSVVGLIDSTPAKQSPNAENADGDGDSVIDEEGGGMTRLEWVLKNREDSFERYKTSLRRVSAMEKIKCKCGKDWKIQDNLSAYEGEVVLVCDCGERFYNAQDFFDDHCFINLCHVVIKNEN